MQVNVPPRIISNSLSRIPIMTDFKTLPVDSYYPGTDVYVSRSRALDIIRLEDRRDTLQDRKDNYTDGLSSKGETILTGCIAALKGLK